MFEYVDDEEYNRIVSNRRKREFIVDDGEGYADDGEEPDWDRINQRADEKKKQRKAKMARARKNQKQNEQQSRKKQATEIELPSRKRVENLMRSSNSSGQRAASLFGNANIQGTRRVARVARRSTGGSSAGSSVSTITDSTGDASLDAMLSDLLSNPVDDLGSVEQPSLSTAPQHLSFVENTSPQCDDVPYDNGDHHHMEVDADDVSEPRPAAHVPPAPQAQPNPHTHHQPAQQPDARPPQHSPSATQTSSAATSSSAARGVSTLGDLSSSSLTGQQNSSPPLTGQSSSSPLAGLGSNTPLGGPGSGSSSLSTSTAWPTAHLSSAPTTTCSSSVSVQYQAPAIDQSMITEAAPMRSSMQMAGARNGTHPLPLDQNGSMMFYWIDVADIASKPGVVCLFGKVQHPVLGLVSCCVRVKNVQRQLYAALRDYEVDQDGNATDHAVGHVDVHRELSALFLRSCKVSNVQSKVVQRKYAFERGDVPQGEGRYAKIVYPYSEPALRSDQGGRTFSHIFGSQQSIIERFLLKKRLMGPGWLEIRPPAGATHSLSRGDSLSWCALELEVDSPESIVNINDPKVIRQRWSVASAAAATDEAAEHTAMDVSADPTDEPSASAGGTSATSATAATTAASTSAGGSSATAATTAAKAAKKRAAAAASFKAPPPPKLRAASVHVCTVMHQQKQVNEVVMISVLYHPEVSVDGPTAMDRGQLQQWTGVRRFEVPGTPFPLNFGEAATAQRVQVDLFAQEAQLLGVFLAKLCELDVDVLIGHNFMGYDLDVLLHRMREHRVPNWSQLGRLRRKQFPKLQAGGGGQGDTTWAERQVMSGRLVCDTYLTCREHLREKNYSLKQLAHSQLQVQRMQEPGGPSGVARCFGAVDNLIYLVRYSQQSASLQMRLTFKLLFLPLTRELATLVGNRWERCLGGARSERVEYLLLHKFSELGYVVPDKQFSRKGAHSGRRKKPAYTGGLVLEPKIGFYDKAVLLLDFNSLYPSIIREFNICFTTVKRDPIDEAAGESAVALNAQPPPRDLPDGVLPSVIAHLVNTRAGVKTEIKRVSRFEPSAHKRLTLDQLDIRQKALKLVANSMYGCLGFSHSRFFAMPLAELTTRKGREMLQETVELATETGLDVIYGDTDSIMVYTGTSDMAEVARLGNELKAVVNKRRRHLDIEMDGVYLNMLLLRKKKYAALVYQGVDRPPVKETKGLDLVRRDWCDLSRELGHAVLDEILANHPTDTLLSNVRTRLQSLAAALAADQVPLEKFIINKGLSKSPENYDSSKGLPHVTVALRMQQQGQRVRIGDFIPYVICEGEGSAAERAHHPDELRVESGASLKLDRQWYLTQQLHPPVARLCAPIDGTDAAQLAAWLGLDAARYAYASSAGGGSDQQEDGSQQAGVCSAQPEDEVRFADVSRFAVRCPACQKHGALPGLLALKQGGEQGKRKEVAEQEALERFRRLTACVHCALPIPQVVLLNQLQLQVRLHIQRFYSGEVRCEDSSCGLRSRYQLHAKGFPPRIQCTAPGCGGVMRPVYSQEQLRNQLQYLQYLFDGERALSKMPASPVKSQIKQILESTQLQRAADQLRDQVAHYLDENRSNFVDLGAIFQLM